MSLSDYLHNDTWVRRFFQAHFGNTKELIGKLNDECSMHPTIGGDGLSTEDKRVVGRAFDFRARYYLQNFDPFKTIAFTGAQKLTFALGGKAQALPYELLCRIFRETLKLKPAGRRLNQEHEKAINTNCLILAHLERTVRMANFFFVILDSPLDILLLSKRRITADGVRSALAESSELLLNDLSALSKGFAQQARPLMAAKKIVLNPTFVGSNDVGGADADFILEDTLYELKTSCQKRPIHKRMLWQALGYALLDYEDRYRIRKVGLILARQGFMHVWPLKGLLNLLSGKELTIKAWRERFQKRAALGMWSDKVG